MGSIAGEWADFRRNQEDLPTLPQVTWSAVVTKAPKNAHSKLSVAANWSIDGGTLELGEATWFKIGSRVLPKRGDLCTVVLDDIGEPHVVGWQENELVPELSGPKGEKGATGNTGERGEKGEPNQLVFVNKGENFTLVNGQYGKLTGNFTATLPSPSVSNQRCGLQSVNGTGTAPGKLKTPSGAIVGPGISATEISLGIPRAAVEVQSDGTNWNIVSGERDTGWISMTSMLVAEWTSNSSFPAFYRIRGSFLKMRGAVTPGSGAQFATMASGLIIPNTQFFPCVTGTGVGVGNIEVADNAAVIASTSSAIVWLPSIQYELV